MSEYTPRLALSLTRRDYDRSLSAIHMQWPWPRKNKLGRPMRDPNGLHGVAHYPGSPEDLDIVCMAVRLHAVRDS